ncbi:hypothetical protein D5086_000895 [Populus alba]|uniref:Uncharacterized protein n=1 Tax=Populus alba TaxID=43335 RepID=A0ACC4CXD4_POPAL
MATSTTVATTTTKAQHIKVQAQPIKPKRRKYRETTISSSASATTNNNSGSAYLAQTRKLDPPTIVSPDSTWCCPASKPLPPPPPPPPSPPPQKTRLPVNPSPQLDSVTTLSSKFKIQLSPGSLSPVMDFTTTTTTLTNGHHHVASPNEHPSFPSSFTKFNSALTAGLLNPMSPPPPDHKPRSSPTLFEMMASEPEMQPKTITQMPINAYNGNISFRNTQSSQMSVQDRQALILQRITDILGNRSPGNQFNDSNSSDVKLTLSSKDGISVSMDVHRQILVSAAIGFDAGVLSCLEYLEAAPWAEDEEEKVASLLSELRLEGVGAGEVLKRVSVEVTHGAGDSSDNEEVLLKLLHVVLEGKDEKARREMKGLVSKMLRENSSQNDLRKESLYLACNGCLQLFQDHFLRAASGDLNDVGLIARQADNLHWILDILIDRQIAEEFLKTWASQSELSDVHSKIPAVHRYGVSRVTARLFVGIGKGQLLASKEARCLLLQTWLVPFYDDFGWMRRASKGLDRHLIEDGLSNTILTLPLAWQQDIFLAWFDRFLNSGEDCPNIQRGFEIWWRRAFWRRSGEHERTRPIRITTATIENS